jgi:hypothetical protein
MGGIGALTAGSIFKPPFVVSSNDSRIRDSELIQARWDITMYDRPGWCNHAWYHIVEEDGTILVSVQSCDMRAPYSDYIRSITDDIVLKSSDSGRSWSVGRDSAITSFPWGCYGLPARTSAGTLISIVSSDYVLSPEQRNEHLQRYGLTKHYPKNSEWLYRPWPLSMAPHLRRAGLYVSEGNEQSGALAFSLSGFCLRRLRGVSRRCLSEMPHLIL